MHHYYLLLRISLLTFLLSILFSISVIAYNNYLYDTTTCYWCFSGECRVQTGGTGWEVCEDASSGGSQCGFGGQSCCIGCPVED